jgi:uncharacterized membrane protein YqjE
MALRAIGAAGVLMVRQRLELAALDVEDELVLWAAMLARVLAVAMFAVLALAAAGALVVIALWDVARVPAIAGVAVVYLVGAIVAWQRLLRAWAAKPRFMEATLEELRRDGAELSA